MLCTIATIVIKKLYDKKKVETLSDCCGMSFFIFYCQVKFGTLCGFISSETLSKHRKEMICPEQFTLLAMSLAERLQSDLLTRPLLKIFLQYMLLNFQ